MIHIEGLDGLGRIIEVPVKSRCHDGRKVPEGIELERFMQLSVYRWAEKTLIMILFLFIILFLYIQLTPGLY